MTTKDNTAELKRALGGMLFAFDDGVGRDFSADVLDFARRLTPAVEFKPDAETPKCDCCDHSPELAAICEQADAYRERMNSVKAEARQNFEIHAEALGFMTAHKKPNSKDMLEFDNPEPWEEYFFTSTGHRWAGYLALCMELENQK